MAKVKKKLTTAQKRAKRKAKIERQKQYQRVFINGKQVRVKREPTIDGLPVDEYIEQYADPIFLQQNGMYELLHEKEIENIKEKVIETQNGEYSIPF